MRPEDLLELSLEAKRFFGKDGGVTFGGGEPTLQSDDLLTALGLLKQKGIHSAVESNASTKSYSKIIGNCDLLISDLKAVTASKLKKHASFAKSSLILENLMDAAVRQDSFILRIPIVPFLNGSKSESTKIRNFVELMRAMRKKELGKPLIVEEIKLHHYGKPKYLALGLEYTADTRQETI